MTVQQAVKTGAGFADRARSRRSRPDRRPPGNNPPGRIRRHTAK